MFLLIYLAIAIAEMSLGALGVFLFAMFRLGPKVSGLNSKLYQIESNLPHLVRTQKFIDELKQNREPDRDTEPVPEKVRTVTVDDVHFSYQGQDDEALSGISLELKKASLLASSGSQGPGNRQSCRC